MSVRILEGDMLTVLPTLDAETFHAVITDPPYHLTSIVKRFGSTAAAPCKVGRTGAYDRAARGFMGQTWDGGDIAMRPETWAEVLRVMKPGAFMVAFASTRGYHRMVCAIDDAGFVIHPMLGWVFGSGFPKATRFKIPGMEGRRYGLQALKPAFEPICLAQKPFEGTGNENWLEYGCGGLNIDACRIDPGSHVPGGGGLKGGAASRHEGWQRHAHLTNEAIESHTLGRWPANLIHDGSDEVMAAFAAYGDRKLGGVKGARSGAAGVFEGGHEGGQDRVGYADSGSAARFFYCAKADSDDRAGSKHPTIKPLALMSWLAKLITPPGGTILDPFAGSGTTLLAADRLQFDVVGIEQSAEYAADIRRRMASDVPLFADASG